MQPKTCYVPSKAKAVGSFEVEIEEALEDAKFEIKDWTRDQIIEQVISHGFQDLKTAKKSNKAD